MQFLCQSKNWSASGSLARPFGAKHKRSAINLFAPSSRFIKSKTVLKELREKMLVVELSELFILREKYNAEMLEDRNMLKQMEERTKTHIKKSQRRVANLQNLNIAQEEYVKERFGMDISAFR